MGTPLNGCLNLKINAVCRICLTEDLDKSKSLFDCENSALISDKVMLIAPITILREDFFPSLICWQCHEELEVAVGFREKCEKSDNILRKFYDKSTKDVCLDVKKKESKKEVDYEYLDSNVFDDNVDFERTPLNKKEKKRKKKDRGIKNELVNKISDTSEVLSEELLNLKKEIKSSDINEFENNPGDKDQADSNGVIDDSEVKKEGFECHVCQKPLKTQLSLERHLRCMHKDRNRKGLVTGYGSHRLFHCSECSYSTRHSQSLVYHSRVHSGERPHACHICNKRFTQPGSLNCHLRTHSDQTYFTCPQCGKQFKYKETFVKHQNVHITEKKYICSICNQGLKSKKTLESHLNRHYNIKNFNCETCGCTFVTHVELLNHAKKHATEKNFHCNLCEFKTNMKKGLESHLIRHTGEKLYKCDLCDQACYTNGELKCHMRKHTKEKNFSCPVCGIRFIHSSSVNKHMLKTHGVKYSRNDHIDRRIIKPGIFTQPEIAVVSA